MPPAGVTRTGVIRARLVLYIGSALLGGLIPLLVLCGTQLTLMLVMLSGWTLLPLLSLALPLQATRRGLHPFEAFWPPVVCYALGWLAMRLPPPGMPMLVAIVVALLSASAGQELRRRKKTAPSKHL